MKFLTSLVLSAAVALAMAPAQAAQTLNAAKSTLGFTFKQMNVPTEGRFKSFAANVSFDAAKPEATKAVFTVDLGSVDVGSADGNTTVRGASFFNIASLPKATFTAKSVKALGGGKFETHGTLSLKGVSREVVSTFTAASAGNETTLQGSFPLKRLQFKVGDGAWDDTEAIADLVTVKYKFVLTGK
ncbi:YceI family protein [Chromobacterium haemolyticum]|uniref:YceI family protein n=1 Tax=Chromobacterium fluminis TaxID=3044269 RepID=A0ABX0L8G5_9NEIS|nr:YceI family protein [Chromobacterium haemolyticum]NHR07070.1 YceI family protein [Chromobacterium haemolyticum]